VKIQRGKYMFGRSLSAGHSRTTNERTNGPTNHCIKLHAVLTNSSIDRYWSLYMNLGTCHGEAQCQDMLSDL
jgi:hypothetical protein